ncbi:sensor histidine kinase [Microlunatus panaciterrae]|uniref:histidine kinase n=1 Tax=Microlunatus panaciterrae TaxID=400768 RepID=A0ABS2RFT6_9ACTN|nr:ATP-binding protein [Microlunatus panaciterrae]MBM7797856.1 signal transduction histidine kinase [Microlunatus panaciterrae]
MVVRVRRWWRRPGPSQRRRPPPRALIDSSRGRSPFLYQLPFVALLGLILVAVALFTPATLGARGVFMAMSTVMVASTMALAVRWSRLPHWAVAIIPILDILAVPFLQDSLGGVRVSSLMIIPAVWMSAQWFLPGVLVSSSVAILAIWSAVPLGGADPFADPSRFFLLPAVIIMVGVALALISRRGGATQAMLEQQSRLTEKALERSNRQQLMLDGILNAMPVGIVALDRDGQPTIVNRRHRRLLGRDFGGRVPTDRDLELTMFESDGSTPLSKEDSPLSRARRGESFDHALVWADSAVTEGELSALDISARQIRDERGEPAGAVLAFLDVTREMEALAAREELIAAVSHELRTPLTSIVGYLELLQDHAELSDQSRQMVAVASSNADRLLKIVSDLLAAAREGDAPMSIAPVQIDLVPLIQDSIRLIQPRASEAGIEVLASLPSSLEVNADGLRMRQVIDNVLSNAVKYGRANGHVWVSLSQGPAHEHRPEDGTARPSQLVRLTIADDGIGISAEGQGRLFTRFYRDESARRTSVHGAGLGLHISRAIMRQHGGDIQVSSEPDVGTTVTVMIPLRPAAATTRTDGAVDA